MPYCCSRYFSSECALIQHALNSSNHKDRQFQHQPARQTEYRQARQIELPERDCDYCDREFYSEQALHQHCSTASDHPYCISCERMFFDDHSLDQHLRSRIHVGCTMKCPWCTRTFSTAAGVTIHLESGTCSSGIDRHKINHTFRRLDCNNVITLPMLTMPGYDREETFATGQAWNGYAFECYICPREFSSLTALNQHLKSPAHEQDTYRCPKAGCARTYKSLSGLVQHFESQSCGFITFDKVQKEARNGVQNMFSMMLESGY